MKKTKKSTPAKKDRAMFFNDRALTCEFLVPGPQEPVEFGYLRLFTVFALLPEWALDLYHGHGAPFDRLDAFHQYLGRITYAETANPGGFKHISSFMPYPLRDGLLDLSADGTVGVLHRTPHQPSQPSRQVPAWARTLFVRAKTIADTLLTPKWLGDDDPRDAMRASITHTMLRADHHLNKVNLAEVVALYDDFAANRTDLDRSNVETTARRREYARRCALHTRASTGSIYDLRASRYCAGRDAWWHVFRGDGTAPTTATLATRLYDSLVVLIQRSRQPIPGSDERSLAPDVVIPPARRAQFTAIISAVAPFIDMAALCRSALDTATDVFYENYAAHAMFTSHSSHSRAGEQWLKEKSPAMYAAHHLRVAAEAAERATGSVPPRAYTTGPAPPPPAPVDPNAPPPRRPPGNKQRKAKPRDAAELGSDDDDDDAPALPKRRPPDGTPSRKKPAQQHSPTTTVIKFSNYQDAADDAVSPPSPSSYTAEMLKPAPAVSSSSFIAPPPPPSDEVAPPAYDDTAAYANDWLKDSDDDEATEMDTGDRSAPTVNLSPAPMETRTWVDYNDIPQAPPLFSFGVVAEPAPAPTKAAAATYTDKLEEMALYETPPASPVRPTAAAAAAPPPPPQPVREPPRSSAASSASGSPSLAPSSNSPFIDTTPFSTKMLAAMSVIQATWQTDAPAAKAAATGRRPTTTTTLQSDRVK